MRSNSEAFCRSSRSRYWSILSFCSFSIILAFLGHFSVFPSTVFQIPAVYSTEAPDILRLVDIKSGTQKGGTVCIGSMVVMLENCGHNGNMLELLVTKPGFEKY